MTVFARSSITDSVVGASVSASSERICKYLNDIVDEEGSAGGFSGVLLRPICVPAELGELEDEIKLSRDGKNIEIFYNIPYDDWEDRSINNKDVTNIESLCLALRSTDNRRLNDERRAHLIDLVSCVDIETFL